MINKARIKFISEINVLDGILSMSISKNKSLNTALFQVRKRFSHLYQLIFGSQFSSEEVKDNSSS